MLLVGILLTVLLALEWSAHIPGRKATLWLFLAGAAWWVASALLVRGDFAWRLWYSVNTLSLLLVTLSIGFWLAGEIERAGHLIPVCIVGTLVDIWSVLEGPSRRVGQQVVTHMQMQVDTGVRQPPPMVDFLVLHWPEPGADMMAPLVGLGDMVFVSLFLASCRRFGLSLTKCVVLVLAGLASAMAVAMWLEKPTPALPFICGLFLLGNFRGLSMTRREWKITWVIAAAMILVGFAGYFRSFVLGG
jgi:hypothetical protein